RRPMVVVVVWAADQRSSAVARQRDAEALVGVADRARSYELRALLRPGRARAREHPRRPHAAVVVRAADQRGAAVARQRDAEALVGVADRARSYELGALLRPARARARQHPRRPHAAVVAWAADKRGVPIARQRDA